MPAPRKNPTRASGRQRPSVSRAERVRKQTEALEGRLGREKARARISTTERQIPWKKALARAEERLRRARATDDPGLADKLNQEAAELIAESKRLRNKPTANLIERASRINAWRRNTAKMMPSRTLIAWCEQFGRWCLNADGTATGEAHFNVPDTRGSEEKSPQRSYKAFRKWFFELQSRSQWLDEEPVYLALGYTVGGDMLRSSSDRGRYDKIRGTSALISNWRTGTVLGGERGYPYLVSSWLDEVARNVFEKGLRISAIAFFVHYGPTPPLSEGEFNCEQPSISSKWGTGYERQMPAPAKPAKPEKKPTKKPAKKKKQAPKVTRMFVVYDENGRKYLNRPAYSGRAAKIWGPLKEAHFFETRQKAQSAASNLNASRPARSKYRAVVWPVDVTET